MDNNLNKSEKNELKNVMDSFISSYAQRDKNINFSSWLAERLQKEIPDMSAESGKKLSEEIIEAVAAYDRTLGELNKAVESGQSKEGWLADRMAEVYEDMPIEEADGRLREFERDLTVSNAQLMHDMPQQKSEEIIETEFAEPNEYSLKNKALNIGKQALMSGLGVAMNVIENNIDGEEGVNISDTIGEALQAGLETASGEVKSVVAGAIKTAVENKVTDILSEDTPTESICDIAGAAVESASALANVAMGKSTIPEALDKIGRASVAAVCRLGANALKNALVNIPYVGPIAAKLASGLINHMKSPKFKENVYTVVKDAAVATWQGIKEVGKGIFSKIKNKAKALFN